MFLLAPLADSYITPGSNLRNQIAQAAMPPARAPKPSPGWRSR
jgi:hypothetical protein